MVKHTSKIIKRTLQVTLAAAILFFWATAGLALDKVNQNFFGVAIKGYDSVAYHTEGLAVKGKKKFSHTWNDAKWYFSSAENWDKKSTANFADNSDEAIKKADQSWTKLNQDN